jgi:hypothetical protein
MPVPEQMKGGFVPFYEGMEVVVEVMLADQDYEHPRVYSHST